MRRWLWTLLIVSIGVIAWPAIASAQAARAWLDRDSMQLGETVTLNVEVDGNAGIEPDFSVLGGDFNLLGTQSSRQFSLVNGQSTAKTVWAVGLEPKHAGALAIPALTIGSASTAAITLTVLPAPVGAQGKPGDNVFVEVTADPVSPYVQQQVRYTVKLHYAIDLTEGSLDEPTAPGVVVQKLGRDRQYVATLGERRYNVLERRYALLPEQSGTLTLPALAFRGSTPDTSDPTGFFRRGRAVGARSDAVTLEVRAKPATWGAAPWLPAVSLTLTDDNAIPPEVPVGEPITRSVRLRAQGLGYEQLPELRFDTPEGTEVYPDKAETQTRDDGAWLYGEVSRKFAIVPTRPGKLVLPAIEVQWWDTAHERMTKAVLAAHEVNVVPAVGAAANPAAPAPVPSNPPFVMPGGDIVAPAAADDTHLRVWRTAAIGLGVLWLATLLLWWRSRRRAVVTTAAPEAPRGGDARAAFLRTCALGDLAGAERALVAWARAERPGVRNAGDLASLLDDAPQREAIAGLQRARYAGGAQDGLGSRLESAFRSGFSWTRATPPVAGSDPLPGLYERRR